MNSSYAASGGAIPRVAEDVLPGHPDRLADAVAERIVDTAVAADSHALVGVEVSVYRGSVLITGRVAAGTPGPQCYRIGASMKSESLVHGAYHSAGYRDGWALWPEGDDRAGGRDQAPLGEIQFNLEYTSLRQGEREIRSVSDDQNVVVGYATGSEATGWLPPEVFAVRRLRNALSDLREKHDSELGPDGKVLIRIFEQDGRFQWHTCNIAIHHRPSVSYERLYRLALPRLEGAVYALDSVLPGLAASWSPELLRLNGGGDFSCGGPLGDNGLSGKKLVVDHYGPRAPIGGGALCGKDPHKVDRVGALRARQLAVRLVRDNGAREATVRLGFLPGLGEPSWLEACVDGEWWDGDRVAKAVTVPDLSIEGTFIDLELKAVNWEEALRRGYFGEGWSWER